MCGMCETEGAARLNRRSMLALGTVGLLMPGQAFAECAPFTGDSQAAMTPMKAIDTLIEGNRRFAAGRALNCDPLVNIAATAEKQTPFACVLACIDSRSAPEHVFDQQVGDIFTARVAGNLPTPEIIGSFEYATLVAGACAILVLGHSHCGAVKGAIDRAVVADNLTTLLEALEPAVVATPLEGERSSGNRHFVESVAETNVRQGVAKFRSSPALAGLVEQGKLVISGGVYDVETGTVRVLS
jgi:carbonic anhydrase